MQREKEIMKSFPANKKRMTIFDLAAGHGKKNFLDGNRKKKIPGFVSWVRFHVRDTGYFHPFFQGPLRTLSVGQMGKEERSNVYMPPFLMTQKLGAGETGLQTKIRRFLSKFIKTHISFPSSLDFFLRYVFAISNWIEVTCGKC